MDWGDFPEVLECRAEIREAERGFEDHKDEIRSRWRHLGNSQPRTELHLFSFFFLNQARAGCVHVRVRLRLRDGVPGGGEGGQAGVWGGGRAGRMEEGGGHQAGRQVQVSRQRQFLKNIYILA